MHWRILHTGVHVEVLIESRREQKQNALMWLCMVMDWTECVSLHMIYQLSAGDWLQLQSAAAFKARVSAHVWSIHHHGGLMLSHIYAAQHWITADLVRH